MLKRLILCLACLICSIGFVFSVYASTEAAQVGRITADVNFREGPNRSTRRIGRLRAGTEVEVIERESNGWYRIVHRRQTGFIHPNYIAVEKGGKFKRRLIVGLAIVAALLIALYFAPALSRLALILVLSASAVMILDFGFSVSMLYSLICVSLVLLIVLLVFTRKEKPITPAEDASENTRKAA